MSVLRRIRLKEVALVIAVLLITGVGMFAVGEAFLRRYERNRANVPGSFPLMYYRSGRYAYALRRGYDYFGWAHIDRAGFRGPEVTKAKKPGTFRILAMGASTTFDVCAGHDPDTWPARMEYWLNASSGGAKFEVINAGVPGYLVIDDIIRLQNELYQYSPDVIIFYAGHNNLARALEHATRGGPSSGPTPGIMPAVTPWDDWLSLHSLLYNKIGIRLKAITSARHYQSVRTTGTVTPVQWDSVLSLAAADFKRDVVSFVLIAKSMGIRVVLPEVAQMAGEGPAAEMDSLSRVAWATSSIPAPVETIIDGYRRFNAVERFVADSLGATFIPTKPFGLTGAPLYCAGRDPVHFNGPGADRMGKMLAGALLASDVVGRAAVPVPAKK